MATKETQEFWIVRQDYGSNPVLGSAQGRCTSKSLILSKSTVEFSYRVHKPLSDAHDTPAKAIAAWQELKAREVENARSALEIARAAQAAPIKGAP